MKSEYYYEYNGAFYSKHILNVSKCVNIKMKFTNSSKYFKDRFITVVDGRIVPVQMQKVRKLEKFK